MPSTRAMDRRGNEWVVRRRWVHRRLRWRGQRGTGDLLDGADLIGFGGDLPVVGVIFTVVALLLFAVAAVLLIVPALIYHPYDGGADVIAPTTAERNKLRAEFSSWLSRRSDGLQLLGAMGRRRSLRGRDCSAVRAAGIWHGSQTTP